MARARSPSREKAKEMYLNAKGNIKLKDIAEELGVLDTQIRKWKSQDKWDDELKGTLPKKKKEQKKRNVTKKETQKQKEQSRIEHNENNYVEVDELTERQRLFAEIFVRSPIAYKAAIKAGYSSNTAHAEASRLLRNVKVKKYIDYLRQLKKESIMLEVEDLVDLNMRIAFSDINDYMDYGPKVMPVMTSNGPFIYNNPTTGQDEILTQVVNSVELKPSWETDGGIISEIKSSRQGVSLKLEDRRKAIEWLTNFFEFNPEHKYRKDFDNKKLQLERERFEHQKKMDESKVW